MEIAIIIFTILSIIGTGNLTINDKKFPINWFAVIDLILIIIYFLSGRP